MARAQVFIRLSIGQSKQINWMYWKYWMSRMRQTIRRKVKFERLLNCLNNLLSMCVWCLYVCACVGEWAVQRGGRGVILMQPSLVPMPWNYPNVPKKNRDSRLQQVDEDANVWHSWASSKQHAIKCWHSNAYWWQWSSMSQFS